MEFLLRERPLCAAPLPEDCLLLLQLTNNIAMAISKIQINVHFTSILDCDITIGGQVNFDCIVKGYFYRNLQLFRKYGDCSDICKILIIQVSCRA